MDNGESRKPLRSDRGSGPPRPSPWIRHSTELSERSLMLRCPFGVKIKLNLKISSLNLIWFCLVRVLGRKTRWSDVNWPCNVDLFTEKCSRLVSGRLISYVYFHCLRNTSCMMDIRWYTPLISIIIFHFSQAVKKPWYVERFSNRAISPDLTISFGK